MTETLPKLVLSSSRDIPFSKLVLSQNSFAHRVMGVLGAKARLAYPPMDIADFSYKAEETPQLPQGFPKKIMGYLGAFDTVGFDFILLEALLLRYPDWGFLMVGKTDDAGRGELQRLSRYPNLHYLPWVPRERLAGLWRLLNVSLLLYRPFARIDGAFAVKALESLHFGVPCVATPVPKTEDLGRFFPRAPFPEAIGESALQLARQPAENWDEAYRYFLREMHPKLHLIRVAEQLQRAG